MAGGIGSRFWPLSRVEKPKQFVDALGIGKTFIQLTYERFAHFIPKENFLVMTGEGYKELVLEQLPMLTPEQVLTEPCRRNTAPCIAYAMFKLRQRDPKALVVVTPSDQYIGNEAAFSRIMRESLNFAANHSALLTVGISPTYPATGYGYIQTDPKSDELLTPVRRFKEKPDLATATTIGIPECLSGRSRRLWCRYDHTCRRWQAVSSRLVRLMIRRWRACWHARPSSIAPVSRLIMG